MKLIATRDIHRVGPLTELEIEGASATMIPKGSALEIGKADTLQAMRKPEPDAAALVALLFFSKCVAPFDEATLKQVQAEVAADRQREKNRAQNDQRRAVEAIGSQFLSAVAGATRSKTLAG